VHNEVKSELALFERGACHDSDTDGANFNGQAKSGVVDWNTAEIIVIYIVSEHKLNNKINSFMK
jgi:hypothetical protein